MTKKRPSSFKDLADSLLKRHKIGTQIASSMLVTKIQNIVNERNVKNLPIEITSFKNATLKATVTHPAMKIYTKNLINDIVKQEDFSEIQEIIVQTGDIRHDRIYS